MNFSINIKFFKNIKLKINECIKLNKPEEKKTKKLNKIDETSNYIKYRNVFFHSFMHYAQLF